MCLGERSFRHLIHFKLRAFLKFFWIIPTTQVIFLYPWIQSYLFVRIESEYLPEYTRQTYADNSEILRNLHLATWTQKELIKNYY